MKSPLGTSQRPLDRRIDALTLGAVAAAAAAGPSLPQKAEAAPPAAEGIHVFNTAVTASAYFDWLNIKVDLFDPGSPISVGSSNGLQNGWNMRFNHPYGGTLGEFRMQGLPTSPGNYQFLPQLYSASGAGPVSTYTGWTGSWSSGQNSVPVDESFYVALHETGNNIYGWAHVQTGSLSHMQTAFNFTSGGSISIGQTGVIPEPSRAVLLASGLAGIALARRRRKALAA